MPERGRFGDGVRLAVTTLTVLPIRPGTVDRRAAGIAMSIAPAVGAVIGLAVAGVGIAATAVGATVLVAAVLTVGAEVALTRALHLDGLADTADGLGSYRDADTALAVMRKPDIGPFGVTAVVLVLLAQVAAAAAILGRPWPAAAAGIATATAAGRLAIALACRRGVPAARPDGMGALVADTVGAFAIFAAFIAVCAVSTLAVPYRPWQGPVAVAAALVAVLLLLGHVVRRLGGVTGDALGAVCQVGSVVTYVVVSM